MKKYAKRKNKKHYWLTKIHRYVGLFGFLTLLWLAISGLFLNHTDELRLSQKFTNNQLLLDLYKVPVPSFTQGVFIKDQWIFGANNHLYLGTQKLTTVDQLSFVSAVLKDDLLLIATKQQLLIFTQTGEFIDSLDVNASVKMLGISTHDNVVLDTDKGCKVVNSALSGTSQCTDKNHMDWVQTTEVPIQIRNALSLVPVISLERVFLDTHSGRILGIAGVYFMDFMAILLILVSVSGLIIWIIRKKTKGKKTLNDTD